MPREFKFKCYGNLKFGSADLKFSDAKGFGAGRRTLSIAKIYLKFRKVGAMNAEQRYKFYAAAKCAFASLASFKGSLWNFANLNLKS